MLNEVCAHLIFFPINASLKLFNMILDINKWFILQEIMEKIKSN